MSIISIVRKTNGPKEHLSALFEEENLIDNHSSLGRTPLKVFGPDDSRFETQTWG